MPAKQKIDKFKELVSNAQGAKLISKREASLLNVLTNIAELVNEKAGPAAAPKAKKEKPGDYIEYEDVK
jgi:hypothetical protein